MKDLCFTLFEVEDQFSEQSVLGVQPWDAAFTLNQERERKRLTNRLWDLCTTPFLVNIHTSTVSVKPHFQHRNFPQGQGCFAGAQCNWKLKKRTFQNYRNFAGGTVLSIRDWLSTRSILSQPPLFKICSCKPLLFFCLLIVLWLINVESQNKAYEQRWSIRYYLISWRNF